MLSCVFKIPEINVMCPRRTKFYRNPSGSFSDETYLVLGMPKRRLENNIKMDLRDIGCKDVRWMELDQDRV
jgi:hypothetical protein